MPRRLKRRSVSAKSGSDNEATEHGSPPPRTKHALLTMGNAAARDTEDYRNRYPGKVDDPTKTRNLDFYSNRLRSQPSGDLIDVIHRDWHGNHQLLEAHHGYIQWLFPIREHGMNGDAQVLQLHEARAIEADPVCRQRVVRSYQLMLDFYGMQLRNHDTGEVERADNWKRRYAHLVRSGHNWLRITRILKSLGELGFERFKLPFLLHVATEVFDTGELEGCKRSLLDYWCMVLRDREAQVVMNDAIRRFAPERTLSYMAAAPAVADDYVRPSQLADEDDEREGDAASDVDPDSHEHHQEL